VHLEDEAMAEAGKETAESAEAGWEGWLGAEREAGSAEAAGAEGVAVAWVEDLEAEAGGSPAEWAGCVEGSSGRGSKGEGVAEAEGERGEAG
jgi:hypothetical protein